MFIMKAETFSESPKFYPLRLPFISHGLEQGHMLTPIFKEDCGSEYVTNSNLESEKWQGRRELRETLGVAKKQCPPHAA